MFTISDIQIFIMTHNRANFLKEAIKSLLNQTANVKEIIVLDNESTDNTEQIVKEFNESGVKYIKTYGFLGNFNKAKETANKNYVMLFHDDDVLHPKYIETALKLLNRHNNVSLLTTRYTEFTNDNLNISKDISDKYYLFKTQQDFAYYMYFLENIAYATAIYRTKDFIVVPLEYEKYSKFNDWPFMVKISNCGNVILLDDKRMFYVRRHLQQDTWTNSNMPSLEQIANWDRCFYDAMKLKNTFSIKDLMFKIRCQYFMTGKYDNFLSKECKQKFLLENLWEVSNKINPYKMPILSSSIFLKFCRKYKAVGVLNRIFKQYNIFKYRYVRIKTL